ncbi:type IV pilus twitching motility protein PilT [Candidatus Riflebacteria bacterium]
MNLIDLIHEAKRQGSHDLHLKAGSAPTIRRAGVILKMGSNKFTPKEILDMANTILSPKEDKILKEHGQVDLSFEIKDEMKVRVNVFKQRHSISISLRMILKTIPDLNELGFQPIVSQIIRDLKHGLFLVSGATNSGKTLTIGAMIQLLAQTGSHHIVTIEDPIEFTFPPFKKSFVTQREVGRDCISFDSALTAALRQDPDVIVLGELRDQVTAETALTAAETGHLVISTVHTNSAAKSILRITNMFPQEKRNHIRNVMASILEGIIAQLLIPSADKTRRYLAYEVLKPVSSIRHHIRENRLDHLQNNMELNRKNGCRLMLDGLKDLLKKRLVLMKDIPEEFHEDLRK